MRTPTSLKLLRLYKIAALCLIYCVSPLFGHAQQLISTDTGEFTIIQNPSLFITNNNLAHSEILTTDSFQKITTKTINLMYQEGNNCWIHFKFASRKPNNNAILAINYPLLDSVAFYYKKNDAEWSASNINSYTTIDQREYISQNFVLSLKDLHPNDTVDIFIRINGELPVLVPLALTTQRLFEDQSNTNDIIISIYVGLMLCVFLYNSFVFISVKDANYLYYILYIFFFLLAQLGLSGFSIRFFLPNAHYNTSFIILCSVATGLSAIKFASNFLLLKKHTPIIFKGLFVFYFGYLFVLVSFFSNFHSIAFHTLDLLGVSVGIYALWFSINVSRKGYRPANFFIIAWSFFIASLIIYILRSYGVIASSLFTNYSLQWGSAAEALLLSFALADRINILKKEKEESQALALKTAHENERIIKEQNVTLEKKVVERTKELHNTNTELNTTLINLKETQSQLVESEKMASLGQLTAGIAHEINNPINFVTSNVKPLQRDINLLIDFIGKVESIAKEESPINQKEQLIQSLKQEFDFDYLQEEITFLLRGINEGSTRTAEIVKGLRIFSRVDEDDLKKADINEGLDSTIIIVNNLLNSKIIINKQYGNIPLAECYPGKLNQVFLNIISNAIYAIKNKFGEKPGGEIIITTSSTQTTLIISFKDNGMGMNENTLNKLFEPFFTTKPVGEGTGLGLSISYNTIKKHNGTIQVKSKEEEGTEFIIEIPLIQTNI